MTDMTSKECNINISDFLWMYLNVQQSRCCFSLQNFPKRLDSKALWDCASQTCSAINSTAHQNYICLICLMMFVHAFMTWSILVNIGNIQQFITISSLDDSNFETKKQLWMSEESSHFQCGLLVSVLQCFPDWRFFVVLRSHLASTFTRSRRVRQDL